MISEALQRRIRSGEYNARTSAGPVPKYGDAIFDGDYPRDWEQLIGQRKAVTQIIAAMRSAFLREQRLDHVLLSSGLHGIGKSSIARLIAWGMGVGFMELSGPVSVDEARALLRGMQDGDVLFYDEIHQAVTGGKGKAEWLLHLLQDGRLLTAQGAEKAPNITVVGATTDAGRLPLTILSRFPIKPVLDPYTEDEATLIAEQLALRLGMGTDVLPLPSAGILRQVAIAGNASPRDMRALLVALRDVYLGLGTGFDMDQARTWVGVTADGLTQGAQDYLITMLVQCEGRAGASTIAAALREPGPLGHTEQLLATKGYLRITPNGRELTEEGTVRTIKLLTERGLLEGTP